MAYRADLKKLFIVDGGAGEVKVYDGGSYKLTGSIKLQEEADSSIFDPSTKYMCVVNGGKDAHLGHDDGYANMRLRGFATSSLQRPGRMSSGFNLRRQNFAHFAC